MEEAIRRLQELRAEYVAAANHLWMSQRYYDDMKAKTDAIDEALIRLQL